MLRALALLLVCQLAGEIATRGLHLPLPGPVLGLVLLAALLMLAERRRRLTPRTIDRTALGKLANGLLASLGVLFVPAGVGVIQQLGPLDQYGVALAAALVVSTLLTLVVTVWVFLAVSRALGRRS